MACEPRRVAMFLAVMGIGCGGAPDQSDQISVAQYPIEELEIAQPCDQCRHLAPSVESAAAHPAVVAQPRSKPGWWDDHQRINTEVSNNPNARLVFVGDSITSNWMVAGKSVWQRYYAARRSLNLGISGDLTQHVLWRLRNGNLAGLAPETVVLLIGVNNALDPSHEPRHIAAGVAAILAALRQQLPRTQILLLGILPAAPFPCWLRDKLTATNARLKKLEGPQVRFLDIGERFLDAKGFLSPFIAYDFLHLTEHGYNIWARSIELPLRELLGDRDPARRVVLRQ